MSLRLFTALSLPDDVVRRITPLQKGVGGASWRPPENLHITLSFFGEVDEDVASDLDEELARIRIAPFDLTVSGAGWFGGERPRALWLGVEGGEALALLASSCVRAARRVGLEPERRKYVPHVTLAYCHGTSAEAAAKYQQRLALFRAEPFLVDQFALYSSWLGKGPSQYVEEAAYPLQH